MTDKIQAKKDKEAFFQKELQRLQGLFKGSLAERFQKLDEAWSKTLDSNSIPPFENENLKEIHLIVHTIAGSSGTFSMPVLSSSARSCELYLKNIFQQKELPVLTVIQIENLNKHINTIKKAAHDELFNKHIDHAPRGVQNRLNANMPINNNRILLIEDDTRLAHFLSVQFKNFGYETQIVTEIIDLEGKIKEFNPSVLVVDITLQDNNMAGVEMVNALAKGETGRSPKVPVMFISSRTDLEARLAVVRAAPGSSYFSKPLNISAVIDKVSELTTDSSEDDYSVLVVDDDEQLAEWISLVLNKINVSSTVLHEIDNLLNKLSEKRPDLIILDYHLPDCTGVELANVIRQHPNYIGIPILFLSTDSTEITQLDAMIHGGDDFVSKPVKEQVLLDLVLSKVMRSRVLNKQMMCDGLTGLYNHTYIESILETEVQRVLRQELPSDLCFVMIDIDYFKSVNDEYGHVTGDTVLRVLSHLLKNRLRASDFVGRYGGEEFVVIMPETRKEQAYSVIESIRKAFAEIEHRKKDLEFKVTFSAGIACLTEHASVVQLTAQADIAMYRAKELGRNQVVIA